MKVYLETDDEIVPFCEHCAIRFSKLGLIETDGIIFRIADGANMETLRRIAKEMKLHDTD